MANKKNKNTNVPAVLTGQTRQKGTPTQPGPHLERNRRRRQKQKARAKMAAQYALNGVVETDGVNPLRLGSTPEGSAWALKALHPCPDDDTAGITPSGIPDGQPGLVSTVELRDTWPIKAPFTQVEDVTWDVQLIQTSILERPLLAIASADNLELPPDMVPELYRQVLNLSDQAPGVWTKLALPTYNIYATYFRHSILSAESGGDRSIEALCKKYRFVDSGATVHFLSADMFNQGEVYGFQFPTSKKLTTVEKTSVVTRMRTSARRGIAKFNALAKHFTYALFECISTALGAGQDSILVTPGSASQEVTAYLNEAVTGSLEFAGTPNYVDTRAVWDQGPTAGFAYLDVDLVEQHVSGVLDFKQIETSQLITIPAGIQAYATVREGTGCYIRTTTAPITIIYSHQGEDEVKVVTVSDTAPLNLGPIGTNALNVFIYPSDSYATQVGFYEDEDFLTQLVADWRLEDGEVEFQTPDFTSDYSFELDPRVYYNNGVSDYLGGPTLVSDLPITRPFIVLASTGVTFSEPIVDKTSINVTSLLPPSQELATMVQNDKLYDFREAKLGDYMPLRTWQASFDYCDTNEKRPLIFGTPGAANIPAPTIYDFTVEPNYGWGVTRFKGLDLRSSLTVKHHRMLEVQTIGTSPWSPFQHDPPVKDEQALESYVRAASCLKHSFPRDANDLGGMIGNISNAIGNGIGLVNRIADWGASVKARRQAEGRGRWGRRQ